MNDPTPIHSCNYMVYDHLISSKNYLNVRLSFVFAGKQIDFPGIFQCIYENHLKHFKILK